MRKFQEVKVKEKRTALSRKRIPLNQNECTADFRIGVPFEQNLHYVLPLNCLQENFQVKSIKRLLNVYITDCENKFLYKYFLNWSDGNMNLLQRIEWRVYKELKKKRLKNITPTIISSNCNGEFIYYDMNLQFRSPTINLSFEMNDYVKMLENLKWYMEQPILPHEDLRYDYPTGMLGDIEILFNHYETFEYAVKKWEERKKRIDWDNLFVLAIDGDGCTYDSIQRFDRLPYKNKVIFTHIPYPEIQSAYYIKGFEKEDGVGVILHFKKQFWVRRYLDEFDYVSFLNGKGIRKKKRLVLFDFRKRKER